MDCTPASSTVALVNHLIFKGYYFNITFFVRFMYGTRELINENPKNPA